MLHILIFLAGIQYFDIGLTYDDGPTNESYKLAKYLSGENITAMFFPLGAKLAADKNYLPILLINKHEVGNHTYSHLDLKNASIKSIDAEFIKQHELLVAADLEIKYFRNPSGHSAKRIPYLLKKYNYVGIADWDVFTGDIFGRTDAQILFSIDKNIKNKLKGNKFDLIVLFHDCSAGVLRRTKRLVSFIKDKNMGASFFDKRIVLFRFSSPAKIFNRRIEK